MERLRTRMASMLMLLFSLLWLGPDLCVTLSADGKALLRLKERVELDPYGALSDWKEESVDPCSWFGVECSDGKVVVLNLKDLLLKGTLAPELGKLVNARFLILHNNSFYGVIPNEITELQKLEVLDLGYNDLSGSLPSDLSSILSLGTLILRGNRFTGSISQELHQLNMLSELQLDEEILSPSRGSITRNVANATIRRLMQVGNKPEGRHHKSGHNQKTATPSPSTSRSQSPSHVVSPSHSPQVSPSPSPAPSSIYLPPSPVPTPDFETSPSPSPINDPPNPAPSHHPFFDPSAPLPSMLIPSPPSSPLPPPKEVSRETHTSFKIFMSILGGVSFLLATAAVYFLCCQANKVVMVRPWATGLSGQLRKAFVTGVPALKRSELEAACEDFSNVVGSLLDCTLYKGTLSSGVEIAVTSTLITSAKDWSKQSESQFRKKISTLSKVNHKNFMNLLGYCEEEEPFTRIMVFEYAPNGTLFEHLHVKEAEHLNWATRLRIAMGIAYCLEYMHQLDPPVILRDLNSSSIQLTDDYAAKISDLGFWSDRKESEPGLGTLDPLDAPLLDAESIVYKFGIILMEIISGKVPFSQDHGLLVYWASCYLNGERPLKEMIDRTLTAYCEEDIEALAEVVRSCINPNPKRRPTMAEIAGRLREITALPPDEVTPKISPLWWAELEIMSSEAS